MSEPIVVLPFFFGLEDGRWWEYRDAAHGENGRLECHKQSADTLLLTLKFGSALTEQSLKTWETDVSGVPITHYKVVQSKIQGMSLTWRGGLEVPNQVGQIVEASSVEPNPATGNPVTASLRIETLRPFNPPLKPPPLYPIPPVPSPLPIDEIVFRQVLKDQGLGTNLADIEMRFVGSVGMYYAVANIFGVFHILRLTDWSGWH
jgi:hypothetical protein